MSAYARPGLGGRGARAALRRRRGGARGRDRPGRADRPRDHLPVAPRRPPGHGSRRHRGGRRRGPDRRDRDADRGRARPPRSSRTRRSSPPPASRRRRSCATRAPSAATSASTRAAGTTAARSGRAGSAAATRATRRSASTASTTSSRATASPRIPPTSRPPSPPVARPSCSAPPAESGSCRCSISTAGRRTTTARSSCSSRVRSSSPCELPAPPDASSYLRTGERQAFSFPLVSVAAARRDDEVTLVAAGVANIPRALDPSDPLAGLPGNPQSAWKRTVLSTLVERATAEIAGG